MNPSRRNTISHVIFDFDGTLSWLRNGWPDVMTELFVEFLPTKTQTSPTVRQQLRREILALNGKPSIYQMRRFNELAPQFNASPPDSESLLELYLARLSAAVQHRADSLTRGAVPREDFVISGAFA